MSAPERIETARALVAGDKGLLAMDESNFSATSDLPSWESRKQRRRGAPIVS
jgi:hypothetical protein